VTGVFESDTSAERRIQPCCNAVDIYPLLSILLRIRIAARPLRCAAKELFDEASPRRALSRWNERELNKGGQGKRKIEGTGITANAARGWNAANAVDF
jgi:hypothetical protein